jgi:hypothetical protein
MVGAPLNSEIRARVSKIRADHSLSDQFKRWKRSKKGKKGKKGKQGKQGKKRARVMAESANSPSAAEAAQLADAKKVVNIVGDHFYDTANEEEYTVVDESETRPDGSFAWKVKKIRTSRLRKGFYCQGYLMRKVGEYPAEKEKRAEANAVPSPSHSSDDESGAAESDDSFAADASQEY